jgi:hypothetical protein
MVSEIMVQFVNVNAFDSYLSTYFAEWALQTKNLPTYPSSFNSKIVHSKTIVVGPVLLRISIEFTG